MMAEVILLAKAENREAVRPDTLASYLPAHRLYQSAGFEKRDVRLWYTDNTGWTESCLFELIL